jgi:hypothetical protein
VNWEDIEQRRRQKAERAREAAPDTPRPAPRKRAEPPPPDSGDELLLPPAAPQKKAPAKDEPPKSFDRSRRERREAERAADLEQFERAKRDVKRLAAAVLAVIAVISVASSISFRARRSEEESRFLQLQGMLYEGVPVRDYKTAYNALVTWRSAWLRGDAAAVFDSFSPRMQARIGGVQERAAFQHNIENSLKDPKQEPFERRLARRMDDPTVLAMPVNPRDGELATFQTPSPVEPSLGSQPVHFVVAVAYVASYSQWRIADIRRADQWDVKWKNETMIPIERGPDRSGVKYR